MTKNIDKTFMEAYQDLVDAANNITKHTTSIDESMKLFDQGMKDAELCNKILDLKSIVYYCSNSTYLIQFLY